MLLLVLPVVRSQTEPVYSTHSDAPWSSRSQASGWCFYANTSVSGNSGIPPMSSSRWPCLQQGLLGREMHPITTLSRADHLQSEDKRIIWLDFSNCLVSVSFCGPIFTEEKLTEQCKCFVGGKHINTCTAKPHHFPLYNEADQKWTVDTFCDILSFCTSFIWNHETTNCGD